MFKFKIEIMVIPGFTMGNTSGGECFFKMWSQTQLLPCHKPFILVMPKPLDFALHLFSIETKAIIFFMTLIDTQKMFNLIIDHF
jgi:hypothetical protein